MKLGVVAALRLELQPTLDALSPGLEFNDTRPPRWERPPYELCSGGIGLPAAERAARLVATDCQGLLSVGFCGGLDDSLRPGDLILGGAVGYEPSGELFEKATRIGPHRAGKTHTVDHVVVDFEEKKRIAGATGAVAIDMEAAAVGKVAREKGLGFLCVKVVLDTPSLPLASTYGGCGRIGMDVLARPWRIGRMIADGKRARLAAERLRDFLVAFAKEISPSAP